MCWTVREANPGGGARFSAPVQTGPGAHPASCTMGTGSIPGVKSGRGVTLIPHSILAPWSRKSRSIPLLPLWAVQPLQFLSACIKVHLTFTFLPFLLYQLVAVIYVKPSVLKTLLMKIFYIPYLIYLKLNIIFRC